ncbi:L,D-transpeptidase [Agrilactobacillus yilanensis]|uniref:L,D-transpeptidase n=1 Tax=Agrilactobacillus yilanensis TaxID=2485997 RepID=A0ABW4JC88_9LACO|nr:L,D-transpeptidase [Agrilactobacillus yilanensis]
MRNQKKSLLLIVTAIFVIFGVIFAVHAQKTTAEQATKTSRSQSISKKQQATKTQKAKKNAEFWQKPSEDKAYPDVAAHPNLSIDVSIKKQRVYLKDGKKVLYTMLASTGSKASGTPTGHFEIQPEHGLKFFNPNSKEGANYWTSFKDHGVYLFHTVPTDEAGNYVVHEAKQLGASANSHGCIRLSVADAKWFYENIKVGTPVYIH